MKVLLGVAALVLIAAVVLAANVSGRTDQKPACPMQQGTDKPCPFMPVTDTAKQMFGPKLEGLKKALGLTPEQERKITAVYKQFTADEAGVISDLRTRRGEYHKLVISGTPKAQVAEKVDQVTALESKLMLDAADRFGEVRAILTPAQQKTLIERAAQFVPMCMVGSGQTGTKGGCMVAQGMVCEMGAGCRTAGSKPPMVPGGGTKVATQPKTAADPVCGMSVGTKDAAGKSSYKGKTYYFCSTACKARFDKEPSKYAK